MIVLGSCGGCINYCPHLDVCLSDRRAEDGSIKCLGRELSPVDCGYVCISAPNCARWCLASGVLHG